MIARLGRGLVLLLILALVALASWGGIAHQNDVDHLSSVTQHLGTVTRHLGEVTRQNRRLDLGLQQAVKAINASRVKGCEDTNTRFTGIANALREFPTNPNATPQQKQHAADLFKTLQPRDCAALTKGP